jgi:hypothetical protein
MDEAGTVQDAPSQRRQKAPAGVSRPLPNLLNHSDGSNMIVKVTLSADELADMKMSEKEFHDHVVAVLNDAQPDLPGFNIEVEITD